MEIHGKCMEMPRSNISGVRFLMQMMQSPVHPSPIETCIYGTYAEFQGQNHRIMEFCRSNILNPLAAATATMAWHRDAAPVAQSCSEATAVLRKHRRLGSARVFQVKSLKLRVSYKKAVFQQVGSFFSTNELVFVGRLWQAWQYASLT